MKLSKKNRKLVKQSIRHWKRDIKRRNEYPGAKSCPLCHAYHPDRNDEAVANAMFVKGDAETQIYGCYGCPILQGDIERSFCMTPEYEHYLLALDVAEERKGSTNEEEVVKEAEKERKKAAQRMIDFLASLL